MNLSFEKIVWDCILFLAGCLIGSNSINFFKYEIHKHYDAEYKTVQVDKKFRWRGNFYIKTKLPSGEFRFLRVTPFQYEGVKEGKKYHLGINKDIGDIIEETPSLRDGGEL